MIKLFRLLSYLLPILAMTVIVKGAYVRLSDAGLGCPDWPGCYGNLVVPESAEHVTDPQHLRARPLEPGKAWREMIHRYLASGLGLLILGLAFIAWRQREELALSPSIPTLLVPLVVFQGMLGMWTVTLLLKPLIVVAHLLGGITILALAWWHLLDVRRVPRAQSNSLLIPLVSSACAVLFLQIFLGGWTSANYAALACTDFPTCHGQWWPTTNFREAFILWSPPGINHEFGLLDTPARTAIHISHRYWALMVMAILVTLVFYTVRSTDRHGQRIAWCILAALLLQLGLGITNVVRGLPLISAVLHNGVAAILFVSVVALLRYALPFKRES